jgi:hypothetical protein
MKQARLQAVETELNRCANEYLRAKGAFEKVQMEYQLAKERFATVRRVASEVFDTGDWMDWEEEHPDVRFAGLDVGEAIIEMLRRKAYDSATAHFEENKKYKAGMYQFQIVNVLQEGGYDFKSTTPGREVNAALIQLKGVRKSADGIYEIADSQTILEETRSCYGLPEDEKKDKQKEMA